MSKSAPAIAVATLLTLALLALYRLLLLQYDSGDAYPPYSSFRADPLGTLVFHEALAASGATQPQRSIQLLDKASFTTDTTLLLAGAAVSKDEVATIQRIEGYVSSGGRFVVLFQPGQASGVRFLEHEKERKQKKEKQKDAEDSGDATTETDKKKNSEKEPEDDRLAREREMSDALVPTADISERWGFGYRIRDIPPAADKKRVARVERGAAAPPSLPQEQPWYSDLVLTDLAPEWTVIYERDAHPVVIEREWGGGRIVIATDNYLVSNEAMLADRSPAFLAWIKGPGRTLVFEETHLGVVHATGVMTLVRQYGLVPLLASGILLALLFIWKNAVPLVPKHPVLHTQADIVAAQGTVAGIASLARRAIRPRDVLESCWRLFLAPAMRKAPLDPVRRASVEAALKEYREAPARRRNPVQTYNQISAIINERKGNP